MISALLYLGWQEWWRKRLVIHTALAAQAAGAIPRHAARANVQDMHHQQQQRRQ
jgi:hypothetical protein